MFLNNKCFNETFWVVSYDPRGLCEMGRALIDGSPRTLVTGSQRIVTKGGMKALSFVSLGSVWILGIFDRVSSTFHL